MKKSAGNLHGGFSLLQRLLKKEGKHVQYSSGKHTKFIRNR